MSAASNTPLAYQGRKTTRIDGHARRQAILEATLRIIVREGVRGVRHRAVAAEAGVPLSATTYYFKDIQDLLNDSFLYWVEGSLKVTADLERQSLAAMSTVTPESLAEPDMRQGLAALFVHLLVSHVQAMVAQGEDRVLELAFRAEALRNPRLAEVVRLPRQAMLDAIVRCLRQLQVEEAEAEALVVMGTILELEFQLALDPEQGRQLLEPTLRHLVRRVLPA